MALHRPALVDPEHDARKAWVHLMGLSVLGLAGAFMIWSGLERLL